MWTAWQRKDSADYPTHTMGAYASSFPKRGDHTVSEFTDPSQANWITAHSEACIMTVPEVRRCWQRYVALGADKKGNVRQRSLITDDPFTAQLVQQLPVSGEDLVSFQTYCSAVNWLAKSTVDDKLRGLHRTLSRFPLDRAALRGLLSALYPLDPQGNVGHLAGLVMREIDVKEQGFIDEAQFICWMRRLPTETLRSLLRFSALPDGTEDPTPPAGDLPGGVAVEKVKDAQLHLIAMEMAKRKRDWRLLANCLGFLEMECKTFERQHKGTEKQVLAALQHWRCGVQKPNTAEELQTALRDSGNTDINNLVFRLTF
ncbi:hypothetical protein AAFF_G00374680 [Aldrovandia affinis]|uniref:Death domain-containing protein n=1 Tax=Aldrovandia affinis TaxID=143900 RepID=A0AAD7SGJ7_9TELE|nr:hypothetical protein AAFF_G00374680 [Aldrovandia affinis]